MPEAAGLPGRQDRGAGGRALARADQPGQGAGPGRRFHQGEVLDDYQRVSPALLLHIAGRPMTLRRFPHGVGDLSFFEGSAPGRRAEWVRTRRRSGVAQLPLAVAGRDGQLPRRRRPARADLGGRPGRARTARAHVALRPPRPTPICSCSTSTPARQASQISVECCRVAEALRPALEADGLRPLPKTSGGRGPAALRAAHRAEQPGRQAGAALGYAQRFERELPRLVVPRVANTYR